MTLNPPARADTPCARERSQQGKQELLQSAAKRHLQTRNRRHWWEEHPLSWVAVTTVRRSQRDTPPARDWLQVRPDTATRSRIRRHLSPRALQAALDPSHRPRWLLQSPGVNPESGGLGAVRTSRWRQSHPRLTHGAPLPASEAQRPRHAATDLAHRGLRRDPGARKALSKSCGPFT